jgi:hypothetical protein
MTFGVGLSGCMALRGLVCVGPFDQRQKEKKRLKIKKFSFRHKKKRHREPIHGLIPVYGGMNHYHLIPFPTSAQGTLTA